MDLINDAERGILTIRHPRISPDFVVIGIVIAAALSSRALIVSAPVDLPGLRARSALFTTIILCSVIV